MKLSIRHPKSFFWKTNYDGASIKKGLEENKIGKDWFVCPLGESAKAVSISDYLENEFIFNRENLTDNIEVSKNRCLFSLFHKGIITLLFFSVCHIVQHGVLTRPDIDGLSYRVNFNMSFWSLFDDLTTIGLWSGAALIVADIISGSSGST